MTNNNVIGFEDLRVRNEIRKSQANYKMYLGTLGNSQLEAEINFVLDHYSSEINENDFLDKVKLIQNEILNRADTDWKNSIQRLNNSDQN
jgi:hypothetical protein